MSKSKHLKLTKQQSTSSDRNVVSDTELDSLLEEVEKIQKNKKSKKSLSRKSAGDVLFTKEDEKALKEIFNNVERRKKEFEELRLAASTSCDVRDDDLDSISSKSSKNSSDNESDDSSSSSKVSDDDSSDQESANDDSTTDDEEENITKVNEKKQNYSKKKLKTANSIDEKIDHLKNDVVKKPSGYTEEHAKKKAQKSIKSPPKRKPKATTSHKSDEELDSMVAELLEF